MPVASPPLARSRGDRMARRPRRFVPCWSGLYRGIYSYGKMRKAFRHELGTARAHREKGMIPAPQEDLTQSTEWADRLRIIPADLAERVDARRHDKHRRYQAS